jgi:hypothetical protein
MKHLLAGLIIVGWAASLGAQSPRVYDRANDRARFQYEHKKPVAVSEPGSMALLLAGVTALLIAAKLRRHD